MYESNESLIVMRLNGGGGGCGGSGGEGGKSNFYFYA